jgi:hypothetical protein
MRNLKLKLAVFVLSGIFLFLIIIITKTSLPNNSNSVSLLSKEDQTYSEKQPLMTASWQSGYLILRQ